MTPTTIDEAQIREAAYQLWLDEGQPAGRDQEHWLKAIDALTPAQPRAKPARKAPAKPRAVKAKAAPKTAAAAPKTKAAPAAKKPRATKTAKPAAI